MKPTLHMGASYTGTICFSCICFNSDTLCLTLYIVNEKIADHLKNWLTMQQSLVFLLRIRLVRSSTKKVALATSDASGYHLKPQLTDFKSH